MVFSVVVMGLMVLLLLVGVLPAPGGAPGTLFRSPVFVILCGLLLGALLWCCWQRLRRGRRKIAFLLLHLGVALILVGAFVGFVAGRRTNVLLPLDGREISEFQTLDRESSFRTGFSVSARDFQAEYFEPAYFLHRPERDGAGGSGSVERLQFKDGKLELGDFGDVAMNELFNPETGEWLQRKMLRNGWILHRGNRVAKHYSASLAFRPEGPDAEAVNRTVIMNHPVDFQGWRFYLMSYDTGNNRYIVVSMRRDPGRLMAITGIWMTIIGTALSCLRMHKVSTAGGAHAG
jgi:cytochrome c biogenesis protein ResB